ncbi:TetR/AcrR family transcriptional regulator [Cryptosporangium aurantiacum]|uniref:Transcriptional regulator, TetR family n=1 Tax=Cryptosporangium aurantiacum TaxID=134849 RepID=A0A1M7NBT9_9ACTN|nr:TetR family transcriptional regulator [Cryptosporangium aurantiacum]SHN00685.1 transcriptional regulator, TetR family [Cryptosporangium aurantiacum]
MAEDTRQRLIDGAIETVRRNGIAGTSARTVAATAGVNQALVFYHFGSVADLLNEACRSSTAADVARYRDRFAAIRTLRELLTLGRELHADQRERGNVTLLAQMLAGAQGDERLAVATREAIQLWVREIESVLRRVVTGSPIEAVVDVSGLAHAVSAAFVGMELFEAVDSAGSSAALDALDRLGILLEVADDLGPVAGSALRRRIRGVAGSN